MLAITRQESIVLASLVGFGAGFAGAACAQAPVAAIKSEVDSTGFSYEWAITNEHTSPIVRIEIPHHNASLFFVPKGWIAQCTNLVGLGVKDPTGICTASVENAGDGIAPGRPVTLSMQIAGEGAKRGRGAVVLRFADGTATTITDVTVPTAEPRGDRNVPLMGLGAILVIIIVARSARRRRAKQAEGI